MTDDAYFQDGDQLSEGNLGKALLADNNKDYFDRGGGITGPTSGEITVEAAQAFIEDTSSEQLYKVYPTAETLVLPVASGNNYVYATFDPATKDSATWEVTDTQGSGLTNPVSLLRAVVDTSSSSVDLRNDDPVGSFESVSAETANATIEYEYSGSTLFSSESFKEVQNTVAEETSNQTTTSTSYGVVGTGRGYVDVQHIPDAATPYVRLIARLRNQTAGETTFLQPRAVLLSATDTNLSEAEVSVTGDGFEFADSGWQEVTSIGTSSDFKLDYSGRVSGGTGEYDMTYVSTLIGWRL